MTTTHDDAAPAADLRCSWVPGSASRPRNDEVDSIPRDRSCFDAVPSRIHRLEEISVRLRLAELVEEELDGVDGAHGVQDAAQDVHLLEHVVRDQKLFLAGAGAGDV